MPSEGCTQSLIEQGYEHYISMYIKLVPDHFEIEFIVIWGSYEEEDEVTI